ncbi:Uncharacterised protein [Vibrio cholerae]|nr:Uncharacterised protein [Vibrio cholerae]
MHLGAVNLRTSAENAHRSKSIGPTLQTALR